MHANFNHQDYSFTFNHLYELWRSTKGLMLRALFAAHAKISGSKQKSLLWTYEQFELSAHSILLKGYFEGIVPLPSMSSGDRIKWHDPEIRTIIPLNDFKTQRSFRRFLRKDERQAPHMKLELRINSNFKETIEACAKPRQTTKRTWITPHYIDIALELHKMGIAHSMEVYQNNALVGGIIGYSINSYFAGITSFYKIENASKVAQYYLLLRLKEDGFHFYDSGWETKWLKQFGMIIIPREEFHKCFIKAMITPAKLKNEIPELVI